MFRPTYQVSFMVESHHNDGQKASAFRFFCLFVLSILLSSLARTQAMQININSMRNKSWLGKFWEFSAFLCKLPRNIHFSHNSKRFFLFCFIFISFQASNDRKRICRGFIFNGFCCQTGIQSIWLCGSIPRSCRWQVQQFLFIINSILLQYCSLVTLQNLLNFLISICNLTFIQLFSHISIAFVTNFKSILVLIIFLNFCVLYFTTAIVFIVFSDFDSFCICFWCINNLYWFLCKILSTFNCFGVFRLSFHQHFKWIEGVLFNCTLSVSCSKTTINNNQQQSTTFQYVTIFM